MLLCLLLLPSLEICELLHERWDCGILLAKAFCVTADWIKGLNYFLFLLYMSEITEIMSVIWPFSIVSSSKTKENRIRGIIRIENKSNFLAIV